VKAWEVFGRISVNKSEAVSDLKSVEKQAKLSGGKMEKTLDKVGKAMKKAIVVGATVAAAAVTAFAVSSIKKFADFENKMNEVFTLLPGITEEAMGAMSEDVKALSEEMGLLPDEIVPALYQAISAGIPQENVFDFMKIASQAAIGGVTTLEVAVDGLTSVVNAYGSSVITAQEAADIMFTAVRLGKTDFNQLSASLFNVNPIASALGVSFEDVAAAMAEITAQGVPTSVASTQLARLFLELSQKSQKVAQLFEQIAGKSFQEFIAEGHNVGEALQILSLYADENGIKMQDMFSRVEAGKAALALTGSHTESFAAKIDEMGNVAGSTEGAYERMEKGMKRVFDRIKVWWNLLQIDVGEKLQKPIERLTEYLEDHQDDIADFVLNTFDKLVEGFEWIMDHSHEVAIGIEVIAAALIALVAIKIGTWINGAVLGFQALAAVVGIGSALAAGILAIVALLGIAIYDGAHRATDSIQSLTESTDDLAASLEAAADPVAELGSLLQEAEGDVGDLLAAMVEAGNITPGVLFKIRDAMDELAEHVKDVPIEEAAATWNAGLDKIIENYGEMYPELLTLRDGYVGQVRFSRDAETTVVEEGLAEETKAVQDSLDEQATARETAWDEQVLAARVAAKRVADAAAGIAADDAVRFPTVPLPDWSKLIALESKAAAAIERTKAAEVAGMEGTVEHKEAVEELNSVYEEMIGLRKEGVTGLDNYISKLEDAGATTEQVAGDMKTALDDARTTVTDRFDKMGVNVRATLSGIVNAVGDMYKQNKKAAKDHDAAIKKINDDKATADTARQAALKKQQDEIQKLYEDGAISFEEMTTRKNAAQDTFDGKMTAANTQRDTDLADAKTRYEDEKKTWDEMLVDMLKAFWSYIKEKLLTEAAGQAIEALAWALLPPLFAFNPAAIGHAAAAAVMFAGAAGLAIAGFEEGALATGPTVGLIGEGQYDEAVLPLSPKVYQDLGRGIVEANDESGVGGSVNVDMAHMFDGATFNVRTDDDVEEIARQTYDLFKERTRGAGGALG